MDLSLPCLHECIGSCPLTGALSTDVVCMMHMSELYVAYAEYLERMLDASDELAFVLEDTVPEDVNVPVMEEWANVVPF